MSVDADSEFVRLLTEHQSPLRAYILSLMPNYTDTQDVLQDVNVVLWENRGSFELGTNFKAWAYQVVRYRVINERKKLRRNSWLVFDDDVANMLAGEGDQYTSDRMESRRQALRHCLEKLRPQDRALLRARYTSETNLERFATESGSRPGTLRVALYRLRAALRRCIDRRLATEVHES